MRSSGTWAELRVELLLFCTKRSQLRWLTCSRCHLDASLLTCSRHDPLEGDPEQELRILLEEELEEVSGVRESGHLC